MSSEILELSSRLHTTLEVVSDRIDTVFLYSIPIEEITMESFYGTVMPLESAIYLEEV